MADATLFVGWNRPVSGRESQAAAYWKESMGLYTALQKEGRIESFEPVLLAAHGGDLNGFVLVRGTPQKLDEVRQDERFIDLVLKGTMLTSNFGVVSGYVGAGLEKVMNRWVTLSTKG